MSTPNKKYRRVSARPVKRFFVDMLTRDISVEDAILDLLDNCIDGVQRERRKAGNSSSDDARFYVGYRASIILREDQFEISDNCGGIPWSESDRAFRMGRPAAEPEKEPLLGVGVYGIGMKRAIFKLGTEAHVLTKNGDDSYDVYITPAWIDKDKSWDLPVKEADWPFDEDGTLITVMELKKGVSDLFSASDYADTLRAKIESHYAVFIEKGFEVTINGKKVKPDSIEIRFSDSDDSNIRPFMFRRESDGVSVFGAVGLREPIPGVETILEEQEEQTFSSAYAGWTVICNDRVVLYCNRDELTGWGTSGVPSFHTQFIAISGVVEFRGDPSKLPTTTTKRGLDFSSPLFQQTLDFMREGLRQFIGLTNNWKTREQELKEMVAPVPALTFGRIKSLANNLQFKPLRDDKGEKYRPELPKPATKTDEVRIAYYGDKKEVDRLAESLLDDATISSQRTIPKKVGEASFRYAYDKLVMASDSDAND